MNEQLGIPIVTDDSVEIGTVEIRHGDEILSTVKLTTPREDFLRGIFETWGYSKKAAAAAAHAAMEKLS